MDFTTRGRELKTTRRLRPRRNAEPRSQRPIILPPVVPRELNARATRGVRTECVTFEKRTCAIQLRIAAILRCTRGHNGGENNRGRCRD
jgi:hypothetical protein